MAISRILLQALASGPLTVRGRYVFPHGSQAAVLQADDLPDAVEALRRDYGADVARKNAGPVEVWDYADIAR